MTLNWQPGENSDVRCGEYRVVCYRPERWESLTESLSIHTGDLESCLRACRFHAMVQAARQRRPRATARQLEIYSAILKAVEQTGAVPTIRELMADAGIKSPNGVAGHLAALEKKGLLKHTGGAGERGAWQIVGVETGT